MFSNFGRVGGVAAALALAVTSKLPAQFSPVPGQGAVRFAAPSAVLSQPNVAPVALASCCTDAGCAAVPCQAPAGCATCDIPSCGCAVSSCDGCTSCCSSSGCGGFDLFGGLIQPSEGCFDCFLSPMTNPTFFEDPRTLTEARLIYLHHKVPLTAGGGDINLVALQLRAALTDRLSIIATKDGYATSTNPLIDDGWADINVGLKYNLWRDPRSQTLLSFGGTYELPVGSTRTLQGNGDGIFHLFSTYGRRLYGWNFLFGKGVIIPVDDDAESSWMYFSTHLSRRIADTNLFFLTEFNWYNYLDSGAGGIPGVEGGDLFNLGSTGVTGNDIVTGAFGVKYKPSNQMEVGLAWENPLTERRDVLENRLTVDVILRY